MTDVQLQSATPAQIVMATKDAFTKVGVLEEQFNREAGFAIQAFRQNPYLASMDKQSIRDAVVNVALTGLTLNPELKLGYLIPYKGKLFFRSSYMGKREILLRSGMVKDIWCELVFSNDLFHVEAGTDRGIVHKPKYFEDRGTLVGGYWCAILQNGERPFGVMAKAEIDAISQRSESVKSGKSSPWLSDYNEMAKKTLINRAFKSLPKTGISDDCLRAIEADSDLDNREIEDIVNREQEDDPLADDAPYAEEVMTHPESDNGADELKL